MADEHPLAVLNGQASNLASKNTIGVAVVTNKRLLYGGRLQFQEAKEQFPLDKVDLVQESAGMALAEFSASASWVNLSGWLIRDRARTAFFISSSVAVWANPNAL